MYFVINNVTGLVGESGSMPDDPVLPWTFNEAVLRGDLRSHNGAIYRALINIAANSVVSKRAPDVSFAWWQVGATSGGTLPIKATNAPLSFYPNWSPVTDYTVGEHVFDWQSESDYYCTITHGRSNLRPSACVGSTDPTISKRWRLVGKANAFAMFDPTTANKTRSDPSESTLTCTFESRHPANIVSFLGMVGVSQVAITGSPISGSETVTLSGAQMLNSKYAAYRSKIVAQFSSLHTRFRVVMTRASGYPYLECAFAVAGTPLGLGNTQAPAEFSLLDFSVMERDDFGNMNLRKRGFASEVSFGIDIKHQDQDAIINRLASVRATPILYNLNNTSTIPGFSTDYEQLILFGICKDISSPYTGLPDSEIRMLVSSMLEA